MLKTKVKAGNITNLSDARYCAGMGVDWLGFPIDAIDPKKFTEITSWVSGPQFVLELGAGEIPESVTQYPVSIIQIDLDQLKKSKSLTNRSFIITLPLADWHENKLELIKNRDRILGLLIVIGHSQSTDHDSLKEIAEHFEVLINLDACPYSLNEILDFTIAGVNVSGNQELKPGLKDYKDLAIVLEQLECD